MHDLNYELMQLCARNRDGSFATQVNRERILPLIANHLRELGLVIMGAQSLKPRHVETLVQRRLAEGLSAGILKNRMAALRWWAEKISKARELTSGDLAQVSDLHTRMSLRLQATFGLRRKQSIKIQPACSRDPNPQCRAAPRSGRGEALCRSRTPEAPSTKRSNQRPPRGGRFLVRFWKNGVVQAPPGVRCDPIGELVFVEGRWPPRLCRDARHAQHADHSHRRFAATVIAGDAQSLGEAKRPIERVGRLVVGAKFDMNGHHARGQRRFDQPRDHPPSNALPLTRRAHSQQHKMCALVTEFHDGEADRLTTGARRQHNNFTIVDESEKSLVAVAPAQANFDQVARHQRKRLRVARVGNPQLDSMEHHASFCHETGVPGLTPRSCAKAWGSRICSAAALLPGADETKTGHVTLLFGAFWQNMPHALPVDACCLVTSNPKAARCHDRLVFCQSPTPRSSGPPSARLRLRHSRRLSKILETLAATLEQHTTVGELIERWIES